MSSDPPGTDSDPLSDVQKRIGLLIGVRRIRMSLPDAIGLTAREFGLSVRRLRGFLYGEASRLYAREYVTILRRYDELVEQEAQRLEARAALLRARRVSNAATESERP
jgi:hypothetical protein